MTLRPELTQAAVPLIEEVEVVDEQGRVRAAYLPGERPLTVYLDKRELVTLMTLGGAPEHLVLGYLRNQRLVESIEDIAAVQVDWETESAAVTTRNGVDRIEERTARRVVTTGCGQGTVFGSLLDEVDNIRLPVGATLDQDTLYGIIDTIRLQQSVYKQAGSVHGCALFQGTELLMFIEDVGRHNAVDAIAGRMWLEGMTGSDKIFYTTGRLTSEMVIKGAQMGIPFLLSRSGVTQMGYQMARRVNLTLFARCTGKHFLLYTGRERFHHRLPEDAVA
ncbi:protein required for formate dehydrogenase activity [Cupriavidus necator N-1]|jgi:FdhD protein|uniref:Sulfur carrier protein FdhD n=1 Tax=Cupriavidus necator (strain ATCC 43291 / DSM 13513 / CCUG 52238 / LMG 8453 / N-1) TaxID=1042878 RepID=G0EUE7_CUPNN|nr:MULTISPECIES: formate dehydrogenase accessory sulfurtransferase FdhD [Cupriavidus]AEI78194.1 protein required for formate dehydrogenase activity [Cupriavidus necator N-1]EYS96902.1 formate dehydrogenase [Cupriavidus sp. SK-4]KAI3598646.1 Sulfur carrier protein FdhD [Cupriavidus necator H850]MDX6013279.1 formate dehydrogenase accessory sulfurtransferase FdhD [Cupriavidus necator]QUN27641.1 formate dehydrogenase accessory sulfurtransferase FdhD [Cupriavidus sp. KK10]